MISTLADIAGVVSRSFELSVLAKATGVLIAGLAISALARNARASVRHMVLASTFAGLAALPLAMIVLPPMAVGMPVTRSSAGPAMTFVPKVPSSVSPASSQASLLAGTVIRTMPEWPTLLRGAWLAGALLLAASFLVSLFRLSKIGRSAIPWLGAHQVMKNLSPENGGKVPVLLHEAVAAPMTYGLVRPRILLPADAPAWPTADVRRALRHEIEHVYRRDWLTQAVARTVCMAYWFHPLAWIAWRQLSLEAERACDDAVLVGEERTEYAEQLLELARRMKTSSSPALVAMANRSDLSTRVSALLDETQRRGRLGRRVPAIVFPAAAAAVMAIAPLRAVEVVKGGSAGVQQERPQRNRSSYLDRDLVEAAAHGDVASMTELLNAGADVNAAVDGDGSPLIVAAREGHMAVVRFLLERGADVNLAVPGDGNPLIMSARGGHLAIVELLLARGAIVDQVVPEDENALIQAAGNGRLAVVETLVAHGADVNAQVWAEGSGANGQGEWRTPLSEARKGHHAGVEKFLLSKGASR
jgi:bla regulator protein blaR1